MANRCGNCGREVEYYWRERKKFVAEHMNGPDICKGSNKRLIYRLETGADWMRAARKAKNEEWYVFCLLGTFYHRIGMSVPIEQIIPIVTDEYVRFRIATVCYCKRFTSRKKHYMMKRKLNPTLTVIEGDDETRQEMEEEKEERFEIVIVTYKDGVYNAYWIGRFAEEPPISVVAERLAERKPFKYIPGIKNDETSWQHREKWRCTWR